MAKVSRSAPILSVSVAAELAGMHAQTVRQYDRLGLVVAKRTQGGGRRYSLEDVDRLTLIQKLSQDEGINLAGIARIFELEREVERVKKQRNRAERERDQLRAVSDVLAAELKKARAEENSVFAVDRRGEVRIADRLDLLRSALRAGRRETADGSAGGLVLWRPQPVQTYVPQLNTWDVSLDTSVEAEFDGGALADEAELDGGALADDSARGDEPVIGDEYEIYEYDVDVIFDPDER